MAKRKKDRMPNSPVINSETQQFRDILTEIEANRINNDFSNMSSQLPVTQLIPDDAESGPINIGFASHIGKRASQQDSTIVGIGSNIAPEFSGKLIAAVCDGMGGLQGGETASAVCATTFYEDFFSAPGLSDYPNFFKCEIDKIDAKVAALKNDRGEPLRAGSTFVGIIVDHGRLYWGCVGDSHLYIVRGSEIVQVNRDHNYMMILKEKVKLGEITEEEANSNRQKEALISYMGMDGVRYTDINEKPFTLLPDDTVILCSDGLYRLLSNDEIIGILNMSPRNMGEAAQSMVDAACAKMAPHQDNTSVIIFKYM